MSERHRRDLVADVDSRPVNPGFRSSDADIDPRAHIDPDTTIRQRETAGGGTTRGSPFFPYRFYAATGIAAQLLAFVGMCSIVNGARAPRLAVYG